MPRNNDCNEGSKKTQKATNRHILLQAGGFSPVLHKVANKKPNEPLASYLAIHCKTATRRGKVLELVPLHLYIFTCRDIRPPSNQAVARTVRGESGSAKVK